LEGIYSSTAAIAVADGLFTAKTEAPIPNGNPYIYMVDLFFNKSYFIRKSTKIGYI